MSRSSTNLIHSLDGRYFVAPTLDQLKLRLYEFAMGKPPHLSAKSTLIRLPLLTTHPLNLGSKAWVLRPFCAQILSSTDSSSNVAEPLGRLRPRTEQPSLQSMSFTTTTCRLAILARHGQTACNKAGVPGRPFHDLRRTASRNLNCSGIPPGRSNENHWASHGFHVQTLRDCK